MSTTLELPYGILIEVDGKTTYMQSALRAELVDSSRGFDSHGELATHAMESLLLALVSEGIDLDSRGGCSAVHAAVQSVAEYLVCLDG